MWNNKKGLTDEIDYSSIGVGHIHRIADYLQNVLDERYEGAVSIITYEDNAERNVFASLKTKVNRDRWKHMISVAWNKNEISEIEVEKIVTALLEMDNIIGHIHDLDDNSMLKIKSFYDKRTVFLNYTFFENSVKTALLVIWLFNITLTNFVENKNDSMLYKVKVYLYLSEKVRKIYEKINKPDLPKRLQLKK